MDGDRFNREEELFAAAREVPAFERVAFLQQACGGDDELLARVQRLIRWAERGTAEAGLGSTAVIRITYLSGGGRSSTASCCWV